MRLNDLALLIVLFIVISFLLSFFGIISLTLMDTLSYSMLIVGISLVYGETIRQNRILVFLGSVIFLLGVYFLVSGNFNLTLGEGMSLPIILIFAGSGLLVLHISTSTKMIFLLLSVLFLSAGLTLFIVNSHLKVGSFFQSLTLVFNILWPVVIIIAVLVFLLRDKH